MPTGGKHFVGLRASNPRQPIDDATVPDIEVVSWRQHLQGIRSMHVCVFSVALDVEFDFRSLLFQSGRASDAALMFRVQQVVHLFVVDLLPKPVQP